VPEINDDSHRLPLLPATLLRILLSHAEREEVLDELAAEHRERAVADGRWAAGAWVWRQVLASVPALSRRGWWRGWSGFAPRADWMKPGGAMFESWGQDFRFALRRLRLRPTYAVLTVLTLSLGVAGTAAVFGIARPLILEALPYQAEEEIVGFWFPGGWSEAEFAHLRPHVDAFRSMAAFRRGDVTLTSGDAPAQLIPARATTWELFRVLGVTPALGPGFREGDDRQGAEPVVVLSHGLWRELGGDPSIIGERVELDEVPRTVVGVMPEGFWFPDPGVRAWLAAGVDPENETGNYEIIARMPAGASIDAMDGALGQISGLLNDRFTYPEQWDPTLAPELTSVREYLIGSVRPSLLALLGAMGVLLLIACVNVAALMLGQVDSRGTELAVRSALGSGRRRIIQQLVVEAAVIGSLAGLVGAGLAVLGFDFLLNALPLGALAETGSLDWTLFWTAIGVALVASTAVAIAPGISVARSDPHAGLQGKRTGGVVGPGRRIESVLVVTQVAMVLLMASGAALLIRSVANLRAIDTGVRTEGVAVVDILMPVTSAAADQPRIIQELLASMQSIPGVTSVAATQKLPLRGPGHSWGLRIESQPELTGSTTFFRMVTPDYFETLGIRIVDGRGLLETDRLEGAEGAVVINEALAARFFPGMNPIGQRIAFMDRWDVIVGIVENVAEGDLSAEPVPAGYMLYEQVPFPLAAHTIVLRTQAGADPVSALNPARRAVQATAPGVTVRETTTMDQVFTQSIGPARDVMSLLALLSGLALALGTIGVYGVVSHFVARGRRDWAIRIALGMRPQRVIGQVIGQTGVLVGSGIVLGVAGFLVLSHLLASFLYEVGTADPVALAGAITLLAGAGLLAAYLPARRAGRIDPAMVLREE
jgi:putative ABC transport system permease protein